MDRTPTLSKSISRRNHLSRGPSYESRSCTTPVFDTKMYSEMENDDSPVIACTQEGSENVDVVWDWNSPQSKQRQRRPQKRLILPQSPKIPVKRYPSNNQIQNFEKLREELQALREAIAVPDNEESLVLSPRQEAEYKDLSNDQNTDEVEVPPLTQELCLERNDEDLFNDSADEYLILCTQKLEADLVAVEQNMKEWDSNMIKKAESHTELPHIDKDTKIPSFNNISFQTATNLNSEIEESKKINVKHIETSKITDNKFNFNQSLKTSKHLNFSRTKSENQFQNCTQVGKVEFHRTQSFESTVEYKKELIPQHKLEEIERKRKEALAKLESKRKQDCSDSPPKCSPEEIEKKRLQALAKREAKRQQEIIERKRREALKRLQLSRKKNATVVKSSLSTRL